MVFAFRLLMFALACGPIAAIAQQSGASATGLRGVASAKATLSPSGDGRAFISGDGVRVNLAPEGDERLRIHLAGTPQSHDRAVIVRLLLRSNSAFELQSLLLRSSDSPQISISVTSFRPTGPAVVAGAIDSITTRAPQIDLSETTSVIATGSRISRGPASLATNAVEIELRFEARPVASGAWLADIIVLVSAR
jgi:hypothetical protein